MTFKPLRSIFPLLLFAAFCLLAGPLRADHGHDSLCSGRLRFEENKGQWPEVVRYKAAIAYGNVYLEANALTFDLYSAADMERILSFKHRSLEEKKRLLASDFRFSAHAYRVNFEGARRDVQFQTGVRSADYSNYYTGDDPDHWAHHVYSYDEVTYRGLYKGIDLRMLQDGLHLKYEFHLEAGADPAQIRMQYEGTNGLSLANGNLIVKTSVGNVLELKPIAWQIINGVRQEVPCRYRLKGEHAGFDFPEGYDPMATLVIDPVLIFSTFTGSTSDNWGFTATFDAHGRVYSGGIVFGSGYPVSPGAYQMTFGGGESGAYLNGCDVAIIKYDSSGTQRLFATYLGGSRNDLPHSMIVDANENLLVYGTTGSGNFPVTANAFDTSFNGGDSIAYDFSSIKFSHGIDIFISKLSPDGTALLASTYLGGTANDGLNYPSPLSYNYADGARGEISFDASNNIYIVSTTQSADFPVTPGSFQPLFHGGGQDGVVIKLDNNLSSLIWSSYLGGSGNDAVYSIVISQDQSIYVAGGTNSIDYPVTAGVLRPTFQGGTADGFLTHIGSNGATLLQSSYWGSNAYDQSYFVEDDKSGSIYTFGQTAATGNYWVFNASWYQTNGGQFISKISAGLDTLIWSMAFGTGNGGPDISPTAFLVDLCDKIYLSGWGGLYLNGFGGTTGLPITGNAFQPTTDGHDFYFMVMNDDASGIHYGTFFGGALSQEHVDGGTSRFDRSGKIYQSVCAGCGGHSDFPTTSGAWSNTNNSSNCNNGVIKFDFLLPLIVANFDPPPVICAPYTITFNNTTYDGGPGFTSQWSFGDGTSSTQFEPAHLYDSSGTYYVTLVVSDTGTCNFADSITKPIIVLSNSSNTLPPAHVCLGDFTQIGNPPVGDPDITYAWTPAATLNDPTLSNPIAHPQSTTTYTGYVSNGFCTDTLWQTVYVYDLDPWPHNDTSTCTGSVTLNANAAGATSTQWSSNPGFSDWLNSGPGDTDVTLNISEPTMVYVMVSNDWCTAVDSVQIDMVVVAGLPVITEPLCHDDCNGALQVIVNSGTPPYTYTWDNGGSTSIINGLCAGDYTVTITDVNSCISVQTLTLPNPTLITTSITPQHLPCEEACVGTLTVNASGSTPPYSYEWSNGQTTNPSTGLCAGDYTVTITDSHQCIASDGATLVVDYIFDGFQVWADDDTIFEGQSTGLHATPVANCNYNWMPGQYVSNNGSADVMVNPPVTTTYYLTVEDPNGCRTFDTITIYIVDIMCEEPYIYVPNAFTPNGDGQNDQFNVQTQQGNQIYLAVFDRWGEKIFETFDIKTSWDGTFRGKLCDPGVFVYYCEVICYNNQMWSKKGNVTLLR